MGAGMERTDDRFRTILDHLLEGCQIIGFDWRYLYVNDAVCRQAQKEASELLGRRMMDVFPGIDSTVLFATLARSMEARTTAKLLNEFTHADGSRGWFELSIQPVPEGLFVMSLDVTEHKRAESDLERQLAVTQSLRAIDLAILGTTDLHLVLKTVLQETRARLEVQVASVLLFDPAAHNLMPAAAVGGMHAEHNRVRLGEGVAGKAALERRTVAASPLPAPELPAYLKLDSLSGAQYALYASPLISRGNLLGVLVVVRDWPFNAAAQWLAILDTLAGQTALAVESILSFNDLQRSRVALVLAYDETIEGWSRALDLRDKETEGHSRRVTEMTLRLGRLAGMSEAELVHVKRGALLHDIGKMGIGDDILLKPDRLTPAEWEIMKEHPVYAHELLSPVAFLRPALDIPYCHHEKWDGSGYPRGLKEHQIPLAARLFAVVDVWDALRFDRPYREAWPADRVRDHILAQSGTHFDPEAVELFLKALEIEPATAAGR